MKKIYKMLIVALLLLAGGLALFYLSPKTNYTFKTTAAFLIIMSGMILILFPIKVISYREKLKKQKLEDERLKAEKLKELETEKNDNDDNFLETSDKKWLL